MPIEANRSTASDSLRHRPGFGGVVHDADTEIAAHRVVAPAAHTAHASFTLLAKDASGACGLRHDALQCYGQHVAAGSEKLIGDKLIYAVGKALVVYQLEEGAMQFLARPRNGYVKAIASMRLSNTLRFLAVCETISFTGQEEEHVLCIYDLMSFARKTVIRSPNNLQLNSCCFSHDDKYVIAASVLDNSVHIWNWEKEKLFKTFTVPVEPSRVCCAPCLPLQITTSGDNHLRIWTQGGDKAFKNIPLLPAAKEQEKFITHTWLTTIPTSEHHAVRRMAALAAAEEEDGGTKASIVLVFEGHDDAAMELKQALFLRMQSNHSAETIAPLTRGFAVGGAGGFVSIYDRAEDKRDPYQEVRTFALGDELILAITLQPSEDRFICYCASNRLLTVVVPPMDVVTSTQSPVQVSDLIPGGFHVGPVVGMSVAAQRPLMITIGSDRTARVWNYLQGKVELVHNFQAEEPTCVAFHVSGFQALVGFKDRIRLYNIALSELKQCRELFVKGCRDIAYSHGGHMFATNSSMNLVVYCAVSHDQLYSFSGHMNSVKRIAWCQDDLAIVTAGMDGNIYGWDLCSKQRIDLLPQTGRTQPYTGLVVQTKEMMREPTATVHTDVGDDNVLKDLNFALISSNDGSLRKAYWQANANSSDHTEDVNLDLQGRHVSTMALSHSKKHVYIGLSDGALRVYQWPAMNAAPFAECHLHDKAIVSIRESYDGRAVFSCGEDGLVFSCAIFTNDDDSFGGGAAQAAERFGNTPLGDLIFSDNYNADVILLSRDEIDEHVNEAIELRKRIEDMQAKHEFDLHQRESELHEELRKLVEQKDAQIGAEKDRVGTVQSELEQRIREMMSAQDQRETDHAKMISELENQYEHKLADQLERYDRLSDSMEKMRQQCEGLLELQRKEMEDEIFTVTNDAKQREKKLRQENKKLREDRTADDNTFKEVLDQQEAEYEDELRQLIAAAEKELNAERATVAKMRTLIQTKNTKIDQMRKKMQEMKQASQSKHVQLQQERQEKKQLQGTIEHYQRNLSEREEALAEKEKTILELRNTTKTLENFRFVLDHRLQQLSAERGPITKHIDGLETHIKCMYEEMVTEFDSKKHMERELDHKDLKLATSSAELERLRQQIRQKDLYIASFRRELTNVVALTVPTEMQVALKDIYKKFVREEKSRTRNARAVTRAQDALRQMQAKANKAGSDDEATEHPRANNADEGIPEDVQEELLFGMREAFRQRSYVEKEANALRNRLDWAKRDAKRLSKIRLSENSQLMYECNELRRELKALQRQHDSMQEKHNEALKIIQQLRHSDFSAVQSPTASASAQDGTRPLSYGLGSAQTQSLSSLPRQTEVPLTVRSSALQPSNDQHANAYHQAVSRRKERQAAARISQATNSELEFLHRKLDESEQEKAMQRLEIHRLTSTIKLLQTTQHSDTHSDGDLISEASIQIPGLSVKF